MSVNEQRVVPDYPQIYLEPRCCADPSEGRCCCQDDVFDGQDCEEHVPATKYVRDDLHRKALAEIERLCEQVTTLTTHLVAADAPGAATIIKQGEEIERLRAAGKVLAESMRTNWAGEISREEDEACRVFEKGEYCEGSKP